MGYSKRYREELLLLLLKTLSTDLFFMLQLGNLLVLLGQSDLVHRQLGHHWLVLLHHLGHFLFTLLQLKDKWVTLVLDKCLLQLKCIYQTFQRIIWESLFHPNYIRTSKFGESFEHKQTTNYVCRCYWGILGNVHQFLYADPVSAWIRKGLKIRVEVKKNNYQQEGITVTCIYSNSAGQSQNYYELEQSKCWLLLHIATKFFFLHFYLRTCLYLSSNTVKADYNLDTKLISQLF